MFTRFSPRLLHYASESRFFAMSSCNPINSTAKLRDSFDIAKHFQLFSEIFFVVIKSGSVHVIKSRIRTSSTMRRRKGWTISSKPTPRFSMPIISGKTSTRYGCKTVRKKQRGSLPIGVKGPGRPN